MALARARIFCRCYSLVLNGGTLEVVVAVGSGSLEVVVAVGVVVLLHLVSRTDLLCYMLLLSVFSNFRTGKADATPNAWIEFNKYV